MATPKTSSLRKWATPLTIGGFLVTGVSGVMLFFHLGENLIKEAHEWIGVIFVVGALLHITAHWGPLRNYFTKTLPVTVIATVLVGGIAFMAVSGSEAEGGNPIRAVMHQVEKAPLSLIAQLTERDEQALVGMLEQAGFTVMDPSESLEVIAAANGRSVREVIPMLFSVDEPSS